MAIALRYKDKKLCLSMTPPDINPQRAKMIQGYKWNASQRRWEYPVTPKTYRQIIELFPHAEVSAKLRDGMDRLIAREHELAELAQREDTDFDFTWGMAPRLYPFQRVGVEFLAKCQHGIIADDMGLGKTVQLIGTVKQSHTEAEGLYIVVCPSTLKGNWKREIEMWTDDQVFVMNGTATQRAKTLKAFHEAEGHRWLVINFESLRTYFSFKDRDGRKTIWTAKPTKVDPFFDKLTFDYLLVDEAHRIKERKTDQTRCVYFLRKKARHTLLATGTPVLNRPHELWSLLHTIDPERYRSFWGWAEEYLMIEVTPWGRKLGPVHPAKEEALRKELAPLMIRRTKGEVLTELPPKTYQDIIVPLTSKQRVAYDDMVDEMVAKIKTDGDKDEYVAAPIILTQLMRLKQIAGALDIFADNPTGADSAKLDALMEIIEGTDQKIIVFSQFKGMLDAVEHRLAKQDIESVRIDGETPMGERSNIVDRFQNDPGVQVFLGTIRAAGVGITLTASSTVVFLDLDWTPALNEQAEDRAHRIGQTDNVQVIRIKAEDTVDLIHIDPTLRFKREMIAQVLGKGGE